MQIIKSISLAIIFSATSVLLYCLTLPYAYAAGTGEHVHPVTGTGEAGQDQPVADATMDHSGHDHAAMLAAMGQGTDEVEVAATALTTEIDGLPDALPTQTIDLKDGDTFEITASYVKKQVGERTLRMLAYNGSVPGPFIRVRQNSEVTIRFHNRTDVDQTIHSHGIRIDNRYDGVPGVTQDSVAPGESFSYQVRFVDAGVFWYHPHTREDYGQELGLYGNYLVDPTAPGYWNPVNREVPLVIDDILIENDRIANFYHEFTNYALLGRFGNEFLINGEPGYQLRVHRGEVIRFFVTNVSNARSYNLSLAGVLTKMVGADLGKLEHEAFTDHFLISPAERQVVEAYFRHPGTYQLTHTQPDGKITLATILVDDKPVDQSHASTFSTLRHNPDVEREFAGFRTYIDREPDKRLLLTIDLGSQQVDHSMHAHMAEADAAVHDHSQHVTATTEDLSQFQPLTPTAEALKSMQWSDPQQSDRTHRTPEISWKLTDMDTGKTGMDIDDWTFREGELVKIRLVNDEHADHIMQHPIHLHGQQFVILAVNDLPNNNLAWKDTALVFPGQSVDLLVKMSNTGKWMAHCHIAEHLHAGMSLFFRVEDDKGQAAGDEYRASAEHAGHTHHH